MKTLIAALCLSATAFATSASATEVLYKGQFRFTSTSHCAQSSVNALFMSIFKPILTSGVNGNFATISMFNTFAAFSYKQASNFGVAPAATTGVRVGETWATFTNATIQVAFQYPPNFNTTPPPAFVYLRGTITHPAGEVGTGGVCSAAFEGAYLKS